MYLDVVSSMKHTRFSEETSTEGIVLVQQISHWICVLNGKEVVQASVTLTDLHTHAGEMIRVWCCVEVCLNAICFLTIHVHSFLVPEDRMNQTC